MILAHVKIIRLLFLSALLSGAMISCKNDIETINALTNEVDLPSVSGFNIEIFYTDSGVLKGKIIAPEANDFSRIDEPYTEFPRGIKVLFYNAAGAQQSYIRANYGIFHKKTQLWEGKGQVLAENPGEGKKLETEHIFWDQKAKRIYSDEFATYTSRDGVSYGENGFDANEDLSQWRMKGYKGKINVRDDVRNEEQNP